MWTSSEARRITPDRFHDRPPHPAPLQVGRYVIRALHGAGAMGVVYRAYDPELDRSVAIKLLRTGASDADQARLLREAQAMAQLRHRNVVPIFDVGLARGAVFIAMPLLDGGTLRNWLAREPRSLEAILDRFVAAGHGLAAAHAAGIVHRDFKPDNAVLDGDGEVLVADFGLARVANHGAGSGSDREPRWPASLESGELVGTPAYMPPEQLCGRPADARADQFSFCVALWQALYGRLPFPPPTAHTADALRARADLIAAGPVEPLRRDRPAWIARLLVRGLAAEPERRWPIMQALLDAIAAHRLPRPRPWRSAAGLTAIALAGAALAVFAIEAAPHAWAPVPRFHLAPIPGENLKSAAVSPDGHQLAIVRGDALVVRGIEPDGEDRIVVEHGVAATPPPVWSPDARHLLVTLVPEVAAELRTLLVDVDGDGRHRSVMAGTGAFLSNTEIAAVASYRHHRIDIFSIGKDRPIATCAVGGDYSRIAHLVGMPDGTMVVATVKGETSTLVILGRDCGVRATFSEERARFTSFAASDTNTIVALVGGDGFREVVEISLDGKILSRRSVSGDVDTVLARRHGIDYLATRVLETHLVRVRTGAQPGRLMSINRGASFSLAPDGDTLVWTELTGSEGERGPLWRASLRAGLREKQRLRDNAVMAAWSPRGDRLAVLVDDDRGLGLVVLDPSGVELQRLKTGRLSSRHAPVWLDDHRILAESDDYLTYHCIDLTSDPTGSMAYDAMDRAHGGTYWLARSPRDGMLAMWRNGSPSSTEARPEHFWLQPIDGEARPFHIDDAIRFHLLPSWSPSGELFVRAVETGAVSRVDLVTGELTPVARLSETFPFHTFDNHLMFSADRDLLAVNTESSVRLSQAEPDANLKPLAADDPGLNQP